MTRSSTPDAGTQIWSRADWTAYADRLLVGARAWASPNQARITPPGAEGGYGHDVDGLEGFARTFLLAGFRIAGERGEGVDDLIESYSRGIAAGVDSRSVDRWVRLDEHPQAKVEAASIALILDLTRPWIWDRLDERTQQRVIGYLSPVVDDRSYPPTNWLWFRIVVQTFLRSVGGPWSPQNIADDLALHDSLARPGGWICDGPERSYDHYAGWALHLYPTLWARMQGADELGGGRASADVAALDEFLKDAVALVGADGSPLIQGRSLIYRFAAAAPFWAGVIAEVPSTSPGLLRHAANKVVGHFADRGSPDDSGLLTMGWHHPWRQLAQSYSGPSSPYWAAKGLLGVSLPADHPVWSAPGEPLPAECADTLRAVTAAGWVVSGTRADGIVRVVNHGTDHALEGSLVGDSPLYTRLGYSTATSPFGDERAWTDPLEQSVALVDRSGQATHRAGMTLMGAEVQGHGLFAVGVAGSTGVARWLQPNARQARLGSGFQGQTSDAGRITVHSLVRGPWEVRLARVDALEEGVDAAALRLRIGGWPLAGDRPISHADATVAEVGVAGLRSRISVLSTDGATGVVMRDGASPLAATGAVPTAEFPVVVGRTVVVLLELSESRAVDPALVVVGDDQAAVIVHWPDAQVTTVDLTRFRTAPEQPGTRGSKDGPDPLAQRSSTP